eukprot:1579685-Karenia_brevis.AAC.1
MRDEIETIKTHVQSVVVAVTQPEDVAGSPVDQVGSDKSHATTPVEEIVVPAKEMSCQSHASS